ncbi:MAG: hypothetical protein DWQ04_34485 [Chloroflexi bacterium]|nr:MAG: hypothetical protein DWQ04_34485 [Chloroflexota bacterium]
MNNGKTMRVTNTVLSLLVFFGVFLCFISLAAELLGLDRTPGFGMIQMFELLVGITFLTLAAFIYLSKTYKNGVRSLQADIGIRLASTGMVFAYVAGLSDLLGIGTHPHPDYERPFVGWLQLIGLGLGIVSILAGLLLYYTSRRVQKESSMGFIANGNGSHGKSGSSPHSDDVNS